MQWQQMDFPILRDPLNVTDDRAVPIKYLLDESGVVRSPRRFQPTMIESLIEQMDRREGAPQRSPRSPRSMAAQSIEALAMEALAADASAGGLRRLGEARFYRERDLDGAIDAFRKAESLSNDGRAGFRLGAALRRRFESAGRRPGDFAAAVAAWTRARRANRGQYIWMRRLQQYGPRMTKPYDFFGWVAEARRAIRARGETPVDLAVEPCGAECAEPARELVVAVDEAHPDPDGTAQPDPDAARFEIECVPVAPTLPTPGAAIKLHAIVRSAATSKPLPESMTAWLGVPETWEVDRRRVRAKPVDGVVAVDFEFRLPEDAALGARTLSLTLYYGDGADRRKVGVECAITVEAAPARKPRRARR